LEVTARSLRGTRVIAVAGDVDLSSVVAIQAHIDSAFAEGESLIVIDLERVEFLDSSVLHTLFRALRRARGAGGDVAIVCVDPTICRVLEVFGLSGEIQICANVPQAAAALVPGP
jgi:anti-anti-sigma factor